MLTSHEVNGGLGERNRQDNRGQDDVQARRQEAESLTPSKTSTLRKALRALLPFSFLLPPIAERTTQ